MLYKEIVCPECNGVGYTAHCSENSMWTAPCKNCNGRGTLKVPMTNGDVIRRCNNEELIKVINNLDQWAIYSGGENNHLLDKQSSEDYLLWMNKVADDVDMKTIFGFIEVDE